jgi:hypothetical protein
VVVEEVEHEAEVSGPRTSPSAMPVDSVMPQVFSWSINPNEQVIGVDFGQTMVNLGHHLENITDNP